MAAGQGVSPQGSSSTSPTATEQDPRRRPKADAATPPPARIEDYALIGDCRTAALVQRNGSIDWLCWPRFDSPACFAALLGTTQNGHWRIGPADADVKIERRYRGDTLVLETVFETAQAKPR